MMVNDVIHKVDQTIFESNEWWAEIITYNMMLLCMVIV